MRDTAPIATIDFERDGRHERVTLETDLTWRAPGDPDLAETLNALFLPEPGPASGTPGHAAAHRAAEWLRGTLTITPRHDAPPGVDY